MRNRTICNSKEPVSKRTGVYYRPEKKVLSRLKKLSSKEQKSVNFMVDLFVKHGLNIYKSSPAMEKLQLKDLVGASNENHI